ncbi:MAG: hypothetical protein Q9162_006506 [Coniocarpon cinnabarinum]
MSPGIDEPQTNGYTTANGTSNCLQTCMRLREEQKFLKIVLSFGTADDSQTLRKVAADAGRRQRLVDSARYLVDQHGLDGIDVAWENIQQMTDANNFILLLACLREVLPSPQFLLTASTSFNALIDLKNAAEYLDLLNVKCFDFAKSSSATRVTHTSQTYSSNGPGDADGLSCYTVIDNLVQRGVPPHKIMLGIPAFGRAYPGATRLGEVYSKENGHSKTSPYAELPISQRHVEFDHAAGACYRRNSDGTLVSFDNPWSVEKKAALVKDNGLAGLIVWDALNDSSDSRISLVLAGYCELLPNGIEAHSKNPAMTTDALYDECLPVLRDETLDDDDKTEKIEELLRAQTELKGKALESATLDILWRFRNASNPATSSHIARHTVTRRHSPAPWQSSRSSTPMTSSPRSTAASPVPGASLAARPALLRMKSSQQSPFTSPRASPRLLHVTPALASPSLNPASFFDKDPGPDNFGEYGNDGAEWANTDDNASNASSSQGADWASIPEFQPQAMDMSPYDMLRSVLRDQKTDDEIEAILETNGYDLSSAIMSLMETGSDENQTTTSSGVSPEQDKTYLVGKSMTPGSRPTTPAGNWKSPIVCRYWLSTGQCLRADCKFSHDLSNHVCKYWLQGNCLAGDSCIFSHDPSALMSNLSLNDPAVISTPPLDPYTQNLQVTDYTSFPSLSANATSEPLASPSLASRVGLAPEFIPSRPHSRPTSRHQSPARHNPRLSAEENETFPSLSSVAFRAGKKHHGKRGHGHGHRDKEAPNSLADIVRSSATTGPQLQTGRRGLRTRNSHIESREHTAAAQAVPPPAHIPWLETGERANKEYLKARSAAIKHGGARNKFLQSAAQAWNRNDVRAAKALSLRGQSENELMREAHRTAAHHLYDLRNRSHGVSGSDDDEVYVDLHGLHPTEAVSYLDAALKNQRSASKIYRERNSILYAIVGTGHHSKGGRDKVGKAIRAYLNDARYLFREFSVAGSANSGGSGGILGIDATSGGTAKETKLVDDDDDNDERIAEATSPMEHGKIRILKAEDVRGGDA